VTRSGLGWSRQRGEPNYGNEDDREETATVHDSERRTVYSGEKVCAKASRETCQVSAGAFSPTREPRTVSSTAEMRR
jgi:hypothetical protein